MTTRRTLVLALGASALLAPFASRAQQSAARILRIGYLSAGSPATKGAFLDAFREGLRELGYVDGRNIVLDVHWSGNAAYRFPEIAASLVGGKPDAIIGTCIPSTRAAKNATATIPVVMSIDGDPVAAGLVASLARPGGNVTGASTLFEALIPKWFELIREVVPGARILAFMVNPDILADPWGEEIATIARKAGVRLVQVEARTSAELERAFAAMQRQRADALIVVPDAFWADQVQRIVTLAGTHSLPGVYGFREFAEAGGLMSYGISFREYYRNVAGYVAKVLEGAKPAQLPVTQPAKIELVINVATARKLGVKISPRLAARADRIIE